MKGTPSFYKELWNIRPAILFILFASCKETLPQRIDPSHLFAGYVNGIYVLTSTENAIKVFVTLRNIYNETLDGRATMQGNLQIVLDRNSSYTKTVTLSDSNLIYARKYNPSTKVLTIDPGDSIRLRYTWDYIDDRGRDLRSDIFMYQVDSTCPMQRRIALRENFFLTVDFKVYDLTGVESMGPTMFAVCHVDRWVSSQACPTIHTETPCSPP